VSGDYKRDPDPSCEPFEIVPCHTFITEATFGTPKFAWEKNVLHGKNIYNWWEENTQKRLNSILFAYSLGKSQRILSELYPFAKRPVIIHESMIELTECYRREHRLLAPTISLNSILNQSQCTGELILAPPSILKGIGSDRLHPYETAFASGWMQGSNPAYGLNYDRGFVLSDHADWNDLNKTIDQTGANQVFVLHRSNGALIRHLKKRGISAYPITALTPEIYPRLVPANLSLF
jgi:putative mRNA 3-end processing factor